MSKPDFASQGTISASGLDAGQRRNWFKTCHAQANRSGARWHRFHFDKATNVLRYDGWKARPTGEQHISGPGATP